MPRRRVAPAQLKPPYPERYFSYWQNRWLVRCACWKSQLMGGTAVNNGFHPEEAYPHSEHCPERKP